MSTTRLTKSYDYILPKEYIATEPVYPRDHAKLLVYNRKTNEITHATFGYLLNFLPKCDIFLNDTRVIKARIFGYKSSGGKVELLLNKPLDAHHYLVMIRGKIHIGTQLFFDKGLVATVIALNKDGSRVVTFAKNNTEIYFETLVPLLDEIGHIPLPPYMQREDRKEDESDYQSLFAKNAGAVAAPTASLHFTPDLFEKLQKTYSTHTLTLHIGAGTFKPVEAENILDHPMHSEYFHIPDTSAKIIESQKPILAIGTTVTRTIEYYTRTKQKEGVCDLFLNPLNPPQRVTHLLTNFHLPKSTLIMLVSAFIGREKTLQLYQEAIEKQYRFFSYGDAMLIL
ncbi:MAG: tRNA preQ1(34) S-adenosylmethionine ribosyltransferase-isomerase QueA [Sulfurovum sp.]|nr:tRNA preQ1(34) S-adenosylmethionine ribosyltransferase-isomerase QueA [Sulfurovum sp.]MCB4744769.1 tRNA preQ1(34) S-adenosylmethionine ribosyltransferase-isomerase QueA [Sulfurovum sp.]MCB4748448.1 tRNA preQ1(34) S-adenosylmethionine ribosyltransferase-isomerase QueA [Sulfurovum sp.]MCB4751022.1 tRNA preQ1(34) S-adenosylmethionine ribosyltransferase-isomerase QueA [Sulfurovum sp.]MCB4752314.1 tRNA preQ1(34) S-adenosylmethionine ribosyltransferase-isomerase QueA [Sulfurovum sp.]